MLLAAATLAIQSVKPLRPLLSFGSEPALSAAVKRIADLTVNKDFAAARAYLRLLPGKGVGLEWDEASIPAGSRFDFSRQRDAALKEWGNATPYAAFSLVQADATLRVTFVSGSGLKETWSEDPAKPRLTLEIGLQQGNGPVDPVTVHNDLSYGIGSFFGIAKLPMPGFLMAGVDSATRPLAPSGIETAIANTNINICDQIKSAVANSRTVEFQTPALAGEPAPIDLGTVVQGSLVPFKFGVSNTGPGMLVYRLIPDCGCFATTGTRTIEPNKSQDALARMTTTEYTGIIQGGVMHHTLWLMTNDPAKPAQAVPVTIKVTPRYRMLPSRQVVIADQKGNMTYHAYLFYPPSHPLEVTSAESAGLPGKVTFEPWSGQMADPEMNEGPLPRKGYKFTLTLQGIPDGSQFGTNIAFGTDDPSFPQILYPVFVQKGIIAQPPTVFMGEVGTAPRRMAFLVTRRGKPFNIVGVTTDSKHLAASVQSTDIPGEYKVSVDFDGKAIAGDYRATVIVKTDDPAQREIDVQVTGTIRASDGPAHDSQTVHQ